MGDSSNSNSSSSSSSSSNNNSSSNEELPPLVLRQAFNAAKAPGRSSLRGSRGASGAAAAAAVPANRRITYRPRAAAKSFGFTNEPGRVANAPAQPLALGAGEYPVNWKGIHAREHTLRAAGVNVPSMKRVFPKHIRQAIAAGQTRVNPPATVTSAYLGSHSLGRDDPGWPSYRLGRYDPRANLAWKQERARQFEAAEAESAAGKDVFPKLRMPAANRERNMLSVRALWGHPSTDASLAASLEARHRKYAEHARKTAANLEEEMAADANNESGASGGAPPPKEEGGRRRMRGGMAAAAAAVYPPAPLPPVPLPPAPLPPAPAPAALPFVPTHQRNLLIHGAIQNEGTNPVPDRIQVITFMETGQSLTGQHCSDLVFWLNNASGILKNTDLNPLNTRKFRVDIDTIRMRVYNPGESCPNFRFFIHEPFLNAIGFYKTDDAMFRILPSKYEYDGIDAALTAAYGVHLNGSVQTDLNSTLQFLETYLNARPNVRLRLYILACSEFIAGAEPRVVNMEEDEPPGGWPDFVHFIHQGGKHRKQTRRQRKISKKTRHGRRHPKK